MGEPCPAPLRVAMRSPLPFPCVPDRPYKILLVQVGTLSFSHPSFGVPVLFIYYRPSLEVCAPPRGRREFSEVSVVVVLASLLRVAWYVAGVGRERV